ncbi:hypothetical protein OEZ85_004702 [Tetradesmus obliquus]|uniref:Uncharacterized protein n=1 Tax=Tetradesmus obliquus TaxID=3088 RepID=A0ABY8UQ37_TETOB|nr:hypothetical protein OEZ85_004702 [Tetradesmus obliquus]
MVMECLEAKYDSRKDGGGAAAAAAAAGLGGGKAGVSAGPQGWLVALELAAPLMPGGGSSSNGKPSARPTQQQSSAAAGAAAAAAVLVTHTEKNLVDTLLLSVARCPVSALAAAELVAGVAPGAAEYLLKRVDWLLQDRGGAWLSGQIASQTAKRT